MKLTKWDRSRTQEYNKWFKGYIKKKDVILVLPSKKLEGKRLGNFIDSFDVVVRVNQGYLYSDNLIEDFGVRTDILYHALAPSGGANKRTDWNVDDLVSRGLECVVIRSGNNKRYVRFKKRNKARLRFRFIQGGHKKTIKTLSYTGVLAVWDLKNFDFNSLYILGMNFYETGHYKGYDGRKELNTLKKVRRKHVKNKTIHDHSKQKKWLKTLITDSPNIDCDLDLKRILEI